MSPTLGRQKWTESMLNLCAYFEHPKVGLYHNAAAIYLSLGSPPYVYDCIEMYCNVGYYVEALVVARQYLIGTHPMIEKVLCLFGESLLAKRNYIAAIKCYIATLSVHTPNTKSYRMKWMELMKKWIFGTFKAQFFDKTLGAEWNHFQSEWK